MMTMKRASPVLYCVLLASVTGSKTGPTPPGSAVNGVTPLCLRLKQPVAVFDQLKTLLSNHEAH